MDLKRHYLALCDETPSFFQPELAFALAGLDEAAARCGTAGAPAEGGLAPLLARLAELAGEFGRRGLHDERIAARSAIVELVRPVREEMPGRFAGELAALAALLREQGRWEEALDALVQARAAVRDLADDGSAGLRGIVLRDIAECFRQLGVVDEAVEALKESLRILLWLRPRDPRYEKDAAVVSGRLASALCEESRTEEALVMCEHALESWEELGDVPGAAFESGVLLRDRMRLHAAEERFAEAVEDGERAAGLLLRAGIDDPEVLSAFVLTLLGLSEALAGTGDPEGAQARADEAYGLRDRVGDPSLASLVHLTAGKRLLERGLLAEAKRAFLTALPEIRISWLPDWAPQFELLGRRLAAGGAADEAEPCLDVAVQMYAELAGSDPAWTSSRVDALCRLSEARHRCGRYEDALSAAEEAVAVAGAELPGTASDARARRCLGARLAEAGDPRAADRFLRLDGPPEE